MNEIVGVCKKCGARGASLEFRHVYTVDGHEVEIYCLICGNSLATMPIKQWEERIEMSKIGDCKSCGKKRVSLPARGLCSVCYRAERDAEKAGEAVNEVSVASVLVESVAVESAPVVDLQPEIPGPVADSVVEFPDFAAAADKYARIVEMAAEIGRLVVQKQQAYGDSFGQAGQVMRILYPEGIVVDKLDDALAVIRVIDKLFRIATDRDALGEDPWKDVAGYGLLGSVRREV